MQKTIVRRIKQKIWASAIGASAGGVVKTLGGRERLFGRAIFNIVCTVLGVLG